MWQALDGVDGAVGLAGPTGCAPGSDNQGTAQCQAIPPASTVPAPATQGSPERRGWWVLVPAGYDPYQPYTVIYERNGCGDQNYFNAGQDGYPYQRFDGAQAIQVGLDYDTFSLVPGCPDGDDPESNDLVFMPWLMSEIESTLCVDTTREWFSEYADYSSLAQQFDCAFPSKFRGQVVVTGSEPGAAGSPGALPACNPAPLAAFYVHDVNDTDNPYDSILPGCSRVMKQNGCTSTTCNPLDKTLTTPYPVPAGITLPLGASCVRFNGCPAQYPVIFCVTDNQGHDDGQAWGVPEMSWDFIRRDTVVCPAPQLYEGSACVASCSGPDVACGDTCFNVQTDSSNCGACGAACPPIQTCQGGVCACPDGGLTCGNTCVKSGSCACPDPAVVCAGFCVNTQIDPNNCGGCGVVCPGDASVSQTCVNGACAPN
jgi:hypothetical protein